MNMYEPDRVWKNLLSQSAPTFEGEAAAPYGFVTSTLAAMRAEGRQQREFERIGLRALWVALGALGVTVVLTVAVVIHEDSSEFDPGIRSLVQVDNLPYS